MYRELNGTSLSNATNTADEKRKLNVPVAEHLSTTPSHRTHNHTTSPYPNTNFKDKINVARHHPLRHAVSSSFVHLAPHKHDSIHNLLHHCTTYPPKTQECAHGATRDNSSPISGLGSRLNLVTVVVCMLCTRRWDVQDRQEG